MTTHPDTLPDDIDGATTQVPPMRAAGRCARKLPDHLPRERIVIPGPTACTCCGSTRLAKLGEDITATLEVIPRQWEVIQHVRGSSPAGPARRSPRRRRPLSLSKGHVIARGRGARACWR